MDLQCTVSLPGNAYLAAAMAVEMAVRAIHMQKEPLNTLYKQNIHSAVEQDDSSVASSCNQVRGSMTNMSMHPLWLDRFENCCACSQAILADDSASHLAKCIEQPQLIEDICGLTRIQQQLDSLDIE